MSGTLNKVSAILTIWILARSNMVVFGKRGFCVAQPFVWKAFIEPYE